MRNVGKQYRQVLRTAAKVVPTSDGALLVRRKRLLMLGAAIVLPGAFLPNMALAACASGTICVTQTTDTGDASSVGSFSWAITQANMGGDQTISFDSSVFTGANTTLTLSGTNVQTPRVSAGVTIDGSNVPNLTIDGSGTREILFIRPDAPDPSAPIAVTIRGVTLANGRAEGGAGGGGGYGGGGGMGAGGAIYVGKGVALTTENVNLAGNVAQGGAGGATGNGQTGSGGGRP